MMRDLVQNLPKPCDDILWYYYGDNLDMQTIADLLEYKNSTTVKSTKHRCMSKLKEKFDLIKMISMKNEELLTTRLSVS